VGIDRDGSIAGVVRCKRECAVSQGKDSSAVADGEKVQMLRSHVHGDNDLFGGNGNQLNTQAARVVVSGEEFGDPLLIESRHGKSG